MLLNFTVEVPNQLTQQEAQVLKSILKAGLRQMQEDKLELKRFKNALWLRSNKADPTTAAYFEQFSLVRQSLEDLRKYEKTLAGIQRKLRTVR